MWLPKELHARSVFTRMPPIYESEKGVYSIEQVVLFMQVFLTQGCKSPAPIGAASGRLGITEA